MRVVNGDRQIRRALVERVGRRNAALRDGSRQDHGCGTAVAADRVLRKHGANIIGKQFATSRLADIMVDLFVLACVLSRVNTSLQHKGARAVQQEIDVLQVFAHQAQRRIKGNFEAVDDNEDEAIKNLASHAYELEKYPWDTI